jgi:hypothetical protein
MAQEGVIGHVPDADVTGRVHRLDATQRTLDVPAILAFALALA